MLTIFRRINALCEPPLHHPHQLASPLLQHPVSVTETLAAYPISPYIWVSKGNCLSLSPRISRSQKLLNNSRHLDRLRGGWRDLSTEAYHSILGFPDSSVGKESACNVGDLGSIPGLGRSPREGKGYPLQYSGLRIPWGHKESEMTERLSLSSTEAYHICLTRSQNQDWKVQTSIAIEGHRDCICLLSLFNVA